MTGRTNYTPINNGDAPNFGPDITSVFEHFDPLIGESVDDAGDLPSSGNWEGRTILAEDTGVLYICTALPSTWVSVNANHMDGKRREVAANNVFTNTNTVWTDLPQAADKSALDMTFTKRIAGSKLIVHVDTQIQLLSGTAGGIIEVGLSVGGTDYSVALLYAHDTVTRYHFSGATVITGVAAGSVAVKPRVRYNGIATSQVRLESSARDYISYTVHEAA